MTNFIPLKIKGLYEVNNFSAEDDRGIFVKTFHEGFFKNIDFNGVFKESYYSKSYKNVIRGMHFQVPPMDHEKLVYVSDGEILDVIIDVRKSSPTYKIFETIRLSAFGNSVFIPKGCAHGFLTLSDTATVVYNVTTVYNADCDAGILWNSFGLDWKVDLPVISKRDQLFKRLEDFDSPF